MFEITKKEKQALYQYTMGNAYATINALLYEGLQNELEKKSEGKIIFLEDEQTLQKYFEIIMLMYSAMYKKLKMEPFRSSIRTKRVERMSTFKEYSNKRVIPSNLSTTKSDFLMEYAKTKKSPVLLELELFPDVLYVDMGEILGASYEKVDEAEVLIAPFTQIVEVYSLPSLEIPKYELILRKSNLSAIDSLELEMSRKEIFENFADCKSIMDKICLYQLTPMEIQRYCIWKKNIIRYLKGKCKEIELHLN